MAEDQASVKTVTVSQAGITMEKMKHLLGSRTSVGMPPGGAAESHSVFHIGHTDLDVSVLTQEMRDCYQGIEEFRSAMRNMDGAGTHLTESLAQVLRGTAYQRVGEQLSTGFRDMYGSQCSQQFLNQLQDMESQLLKQQVPSDASQEDLKILCAQTSCHMLLLFAKLQKQYFAMCHQKMASLIHHLLAAKDPQLSGEVIKVLLKLGLSEELSPEKTIVSLPNSPRSSPKLRKAAPQQGSLKSAHRSSGFRLFSLFERKPSPEEGRSAFYINMADCESQPGVDSTLQQHLTDTSSNPTLTAGSLACTASDGLNINCLATDRSDQRTLVSPPPVSSSFMLQSLGSFIPQAACHAEGSLLCSVPLVTRTDEMNNECAPDFTLEDSAAGHLASEEDLDSVINLLSGISCYCPMLSAPATPNSMLSIPEDHLRDTSPPTPNSLHSSPELQPPRSPKQLMVPALYSPASDSQVDELQIPKLQAQVHRRSEGCLDLSGMGRNAWPHQQQLQQHRASLPAVQIHSPFHRNFDPMPDPFSASGPFMPHDFSSRPPPSYLGSNSNGNGGAGVNGVMLSSSGMQWSTYGARGCGTEMRGSGTWPLYQPLGMPLGDSLNSSWSGVPDGSDGSDDSSNGDHFFAVGKDLVTAIDSRHESSDDEMDVQRNKLHGDFFDYNGQAGSTNTWPMIQHLPGSGLNFPPVANYHDVLDPPNAHHHRPVQLQWSDPLSTRNVWSAPNPGEVAGHKTSQGVQSLHNNSRSMHGFGQLN